MREYSGYISLEQHRTAVRRKGVTMFNELLKIVLGTTIVIVTGYGVFKGIGYAENKLAARSAAKKADADEEAALAAETVRQRVAAKARVADSPWAATI